MRITIWIIVIIIVNIAFFTRLNVIAKEQTNITANLLLKYISTQIKSWDKAELLPLEEDLAGINGRIYSCLYFKTPIGTGYILVNTTDPNPVIEEFSITGNPFSTLTNISSETAQRSAGIDRILKKPQSIYLGPSFYILNYPFYQDNKFLGEITIDVLNRKVITLNISQKKTGNRTIAKTHGVSFEHLSDINIYPYYISDEVACIAMVFDYWAKNGFPNLRQSSPVDPTREESPTEFTAAIAKSCEECTHITGIELFSSSRGYYTETKCSFKYPVEKSKLQATYEVMKVEIIEKRPVLIQIISSGIVHTVVGIGFTEAPLGKFIITIIPGINPHEDIINNAFFLNWNGSFDNLSITTINPIELHPVPKKQKITE